MTQRKSAQLYLEVFFFYITALSIDIYINHGGDALTNHLELEAEHSVTMADDKYAFPKDVYQQLQWTMIIGKCEQEACLLVYCGVKLTALPFALLISPRNGQEWI